MSDLKPLDNSFEVKVEMVSDWHIGSGTGRPGDIDSLVRRDADGLPYIPAKTLTGIWRDACETVAYGLDDGKDIGPWNMLLAYIFGDQTRREDDKSRLMAPRPAGISVRAARLPKALRDAVKAKPLLNDAVTFVKPGIMIHPRTGRTRTDFLRFEEMARKGAILTAQVELKLPDWFDESVKQAASALLVAGAKFVERIGGKRRRGAGRCKLTIAGHDRQWVDWIDQNRAPELNSFEDNSPQDPLSASKASGDWVTIPLTITAQTPLIIPERTIGNLVKTLDYIPGTYLLPFITERLKGADIRPAIACGDLVVTNATPVVNGRQGRPTPLHLHYRKLDGGLSKGKGVLNRFEETADGPQLKALRGGYVGAGVAGALPDYRKTPTSIETHNVVNDMDQRPTSDVGGVFSYQSIDEGTKFIAEIRLRQSLADDLAATNVEWQSSLKDESYRIGRARKDDYGAVTIEVQDDNPPTIEQQKIDSIPDELRVWLLSDLLLRDERLRPTTSITQFAAELGKRLGVTLELRRGDAFDCSSGKPTTMNFAARTHRIDSWNTAWVLPRPSLVGLSAGSCFVFNITPKTSTPKEYAEKLKEIAANGLGERRAEGYGQISFGDPLLSTKLGHIETSRQEIDFEKPGTRIVFDQYAHLIEVEGWRKEIRRRALYLATDPARRDEALGMNSGPRMSQWGALRSVLAQVRDCQDANKITGWFERVRKSENRNEDWSTCTINKVESLVTDQNMVWELLKDEKISFSDFTLVQDGEIRLSKELWAEAVRTLVDACVRAHKRGHEQKRNQNNGQPAN